MDALLIELHESQPKDIPEENKIHLTVVHPFVVNTGLAKKPKTRFSGLIPITEAADAARIILEAVKQNHYEVFVPTRLFYLFSVSHILPLKVKLALFDFLGCGVDSHD